MKKKNFFVGRHRNLNGQSPGHILVNGNMCSLCHRLHAPAFVCLSFKGMEIVTLVDLHTWLDVLPSVVVGFRFLLLPDKPQLLHVPNLTDFILWDQLKH